MKISAIQNLSSSYKQKHKSGAAMVTTRKRSRLEQEQQNQTKRTRSVRHYATYLDLPEVDSIISRLEFKPAKYMSSPESNDTELLKFKLRRAKSGPKKDVISSLPDHILQFIILNLSTREGAATCILSRRWRSLWISSISCLNFDIPAVLGPKDMLQQNSHGSFAKRTQRSERLLTKKIHGFTQWVDRVLHVRRLDSLRVCFAMHKCSRSTPCIDRCIESAVAQGVTEFELDFSFRYFHWSSSPSFFDRRDYYEFPTRENALSLKYLRLKRCIFHLPRNFTGFASLVTLSLGFVEITQHLVDNILSNCPLLECLSLEDCRYPKDKNLMFSGPSLLLKHLYMSDLFGIKKIEVHDINLISLELIDSPFLASSSEINPKLSVKNAPHLTRLVLRASMDVETWSNVPCLAILFLEQKLMLTLSSITMRTTIESQTIIPPLCVFNNLKRLVYDYAGVSVGFMKVLTFLETCHSLQELELKIWDSPTPESEDVLKETRTMTKLTTVPQVLHNNLKEVEIYGFAAYPERLAFAEYLLNYAPVLEKMKLYTTSKWYCGNGNWILNEKSTNHEKSLEEVHEQLQNVARSSTKVELF